MLKDSIDDHSEKQQINKSFFIYVYNTIDEKFLYLRFF